MQANVWRALSPLEERIRECYEQRILEESGWSDGRVDPRSRGPASKMDGGPRSASGASPAPDQP